MSEEQGEYVTEAMEMLHTNEHVRVKDDSNDKKYFIIIPRIVKAYSRNPYDFALWDTIKDVAGESGECFLNTEQLAVLSGMSAGQVSSSRRYWLKLGFLKGEVKKDPGYSQAVWHLSIPDLWSKNIEWCEKHLKIADRLDFRKAHKSLHTVKASKKPSHSEGKPSPGERKKKEVKKNNKDILDGILELQLSPKAIQDAIRDFFKLTPDWEAKTNRQFMQWAIGEKVTPDQIKLASVVWGKDKRFNWQYQNLKGIREHWLELIGDTYTPPLSADDEDLARRRAEADRLFGVTK